MLNPSRIVDRSQEHEIETTDAAEKLKEFLSENGTPVENLYLSSTLGEVYIKTPTGHTVMVMHRGRGRGFDISLHDPA